MCQVLSGELSLIDPSVDAGVDFVEGIFDRPIDGAEGGKCCCESWPQDAVVGAGEEQRYAEAECGDAVSKAVGAAFDQALEPQGAQLVGDCALGYRFWMAAGQGGKMVA